MNIFSNFTNNQLNKLNKDGVLILPNLIPKKFIDEIKEDAFSWQRNINFNNRISSFIIGNNQWIDQVGLCSLKALQVALDTNLINFLIKYFKSDVSLSSISIQTKIFPEKGIPLHSDYGNCLVVFIYLTEPNEKYGITEFVKQSHSTDVNNNFKIERSIDDAIYIDLEKSPFTKKDIIKTHGGIGTVVMFHSSIWHQLPKFSNSGRQIIMIKYSDMNGTSNDHIIKNSFLNSLSPLQKNVLLNNSSNQNGSSLTRLGSNYDKLGKYKIPDWKMLLYFIRYKLFSKAQ